MAMLCVNSSTSPFVDPFICEAASVAQVRFGVSARDLVSRTGVTLTLSSLVLSLSQNLFFPIGSDHVFWLTSAYCETVRPSRVIFSGLNR